MTALKAKKLSPIPLSGQDATAQGAQNIISGWQSGTVYKPAKVEANGAAKLAVALLKGGKPKTNGTTNNGVGNVPSFLATPIWITKKNINRSCTATDSSRSPRCASARTSSTARHHELGWGSRASGPPTCRHRESTRDRDHGSVRPRAAPTTPMLEARNISKSFGSVQALTDVDFEVRPGEVMALVGDNGAGKSTLIKCLAGIYSIDEGDVFFEGEKVSISRPEGRRKLGIEVVYQDLALCDNLDVVQNMYLGREARDVIWRLKESIMESKTAQTLKSLSVTTIRSIRQPVASLSGGQRQSVASAAP